MLDALEQAAKWTTDKITAIEALMEDTARHIRAAHPVTYSHELVELLFTQPYCRVTDLVENDVTSRNTASRYLRELAGGGILEQRKEGREILYINTKFLELLKKDKHEFAPYPNVTGSTTRTAPVPAPIEPRPSRASPAKLRRPASS